MAFTHTSKSNKLYHLQRTLNRSGKWNYSFTLKKPIEAVEKLPVGFEVYEEASGQVFLRRIGSRLVTGAELELVEQILREVNVPRNFEGRPAQKETITVYEFRVMERGYDFFGRSNSDATFIDWSGGQALMRFVLADKARRLFVAQRYCFRGAIDDWITLDAPGSLDALARKFTPHLGNESIYELPSR